MKIYKLICSVIIALYLSGCGEATAVLDCAKPSTLTTSIGFGISGDMSIIKAQGAIDLNLGKELSADFATADPDKWIALAATYQYQTCQFVNSSSCGDLSKSECLDKKQKILNDAFDKINTQLDKENERLAAEAARQAEIRAAENVRQEALRAAEAARQARIELDACVAIKVTNYESSKSTSKEGGARAPGPGMNGGRKTATEDICHNVGTNQRIISATTIETSCHGGRCSVTAPIYQNNNGSVCVTTEAWSDSKSFGGGGSAKYRLNIIYKNVATSQVISGFQALCAS